MMNDRHEGQSFRNLPRQQKVAVISLSIAAIGIIAVWLWQSSSRINSPFRASKTEIVQAEKDAQTKAADELAEKNKDTDKDGLTDLDETNVYKTSPYLEDTDGDNISDFEEVRLGKDPLCAEGTSCGLINNNSTNISSTTSSTSTPAENVDQTLILKALSGQGDADIMRQILLQGGADPEQVKLLSDEDLMNIYTEVLKAQNPEATVSSATSSTASNNQ